MLRRALEILDQGGQVFGEPAAEADLGVALAVELGAQVHDRSQHRFAQQRRTDQPHEKACFPPAGRIDPCSFSKFVQRGRSGIRVSEGSHYAASLQVYR